jgi:hypothetical protein
MSAKDRSLLLEWLRSELAGPCLADHHAQHRVVQLAGESFELTQENLSEFRPVFYRPGEGLPLDEIICHPQETPKGKYGIGLLYPEQTRHPELQDQSAEGDGGEDASAETPEAADAAQPPEEDEDTDDEEVASDAGDDLEISVQDRFQPGTMGLSFFAELGSAGAIIVRLPGRRSFAWQEEGRAFPMNGWYRRVKRRQRAAGKDDRDREYEAWARSPLAQETIELRVPVASFRERRVVRLDVPVAQGCPLRLRLELYPRRDDLTDRPDHWLVTVVLRNITPHESEAPITSRILFQSYFEVSVEQGSFEPYPESQVVTEMQDEDERSLALLYSDFATWGIGHACAAGWDSEPGTVPALLYADIMPAVETPSMTPDIRDEAGAAISVSMRELMDLPAWQNGLAGTAWDRLDAIVAGYGCWIERAEEQSAGLSAHHRETAGRHLLACWRSHERMKEGLSLLKKDSLAHRAFCLANQAMLLQQIATKVISRRPLIYDESAKEVRPRGTLDSPAERLVTANYDSSRYGTWRAFQIAFLLMSLPGCADEDGPDRAIVDLIWFPTGGGKTEAYLGVAAFLMFHQRLVQSRQGAGELSRDGTTVLMRYTLRMLTTQQFQRAASLVSAMELMRRELLKKKDRSLGEEGFSLGLWIGKDGAPNSISEAAEKIRAYRSGAEWQKGNPLVLTECPWCRSQIGRFQYNDEDAAPKGWKVNDWRQQRLRGVVEFEGAWRLRCPDRPCPFNDHGKETIPVQVIDEVLYQEPPSMLIGTADKFAMLAYMPAARSIFGLAAEGREIVRRRCPPALIIQDELHLISGPLGTLFGLYESVIESLCSYQRGEALIRPKIVCSTATIRGAREQVRALFAREELNLFPNPGLKISDSFFGTFARKTNGRLDHGRLYVGLHTTNLPSVQTAQVRVFSRIMQAVVGSLPEDGLIPGTQGQRRDPWWTLLVFYNSLRELGGGKTLFEGDIRSRMSFLSRRDGTPQRDWGIPDELSGRLLQDQIVAALDRLAVPYSRLPADPGPMNVALASNIIEVGVDVDRLSLIGIVGQPKTTAQYIQVTGRVGRRWWERPGLVLMLYNPSKARDRSHFEQFHSYHRRLYERVEPTSATPFSASAIERALAGAVLTFIRQTEPHSPTPLPDRYAEALARGTALLLERCAAVEEHDGEHARETIERVRDEFERVWQASPHDCWNAWNLTEDLKPLMRTFDQYASARQRQTSVPVPTSLRQVDRSGELQITHILLDDQQGG